MYISKLGLVTRIHGVGGLEGTNANRQEEKDQLTADIHRLSSVLFSSSMNENIREDYSETMRMTPIDTGTVRGFLHEPSTPSGAGIVLTHGAGGNCGSGLLKAVAGSFAQAGFLALRCDLAFRQRRAFGPPSPASAALDRASLREALDEMGKLATGPRFLGGHSYGGRQASMLAAENPDLAAGLLLLSYPLHPPKKPDQLRTAHFAGWRTPGLFIHGTKDPFGTPAEMEQALSHIPARTRLTIINGAGHELAGGQFDIESVVSNLLQLEG